VVKRLEPLYPCWVLRPQSLRRKSPRLSTAFHKFIPNSYPRISLIDAKKLAKFADGRPRWLGTQLRNPVLSDLCALCGLTKASNTTPRLSIILHQSRCKRNEVIPARFGRYLSGQNGSQLSPQNLPGHVMQKSINSCWQLSDNLLWFSHNENCFHKMNYRTCAQESSYSEWKINFTNILVTHYLGLYSSDNVLFFAALCMFLKFINRRWEDPFTNKERSVWK